MNIELEQQLIEKSKFYHPYFYAFNRIKWFIFGTLTWQNLSRRWNTYEAEIKRRTDFNNLIKSFRIKHEISRKRLCYYKTTEFGASGEAHNHFLIAHAGLEHLSAPECANTLQNLWRKELKPLGSDHYGIGNQLDIRPYDQANEHPAAIYCLKREFESGQERERYDSLSDGLKKLVKQVNQLPFENSPLIKPLDTQIDLVVPEHKEEIWI